MIKIRGQFILVGTSHVSKKSSQEIIFAIEKFSPQVVGIELDYDRFKSLMTKNRTEHKISFFQMSKLYGFSGAVFALFAGAMQKKFSKKLDIETGVDMKTAYLTAREYKIPTSLIDLNIKYTLRKISDISFFKKTKLFFRLIFGSLDKKTAKKLEELKKGNVPAEHLLIDVLEIFKDKLPEIYKPLIEDRNEFMVEKLFKLSKNHPDGFIMAVVGAGHVDGMDKLIGNKLKLIELENQKEIKENN